VELRRDVGRHPPRTLLQKGPEQAGLTSGLTAAVIDSQSVKSAEKGGPALIRMAMMREENQRQETAYPRQYNRLVEHAFVHPADIQDRDGGGLVMATLFGLSPFLLKVYADGGCQGPVFQKAVKAAIADRKRQPTTARPRFQFHGMNSVIRLIGCEAMRPMTSVSQA
jgi:hypothetical protein